MSVAADGNAIENDYWRSGRQQFHSGPAKKCFLFALNLEVEESNPNKNRTLLTSSQNDRRISNTKIFSKLIQIDGKFVVVVAADVYSRVESDRNECEQ